MNWEDSNFIALKDLGIAYRKAKADLYYENGHANAFAVCEYETNLRFNLEALYNKLHRNSLKWMIRSEFVGEWSVIPKGINDDCQDNGPRLRWSDPDKAWGARVRAGEPKKPNAEFRLVGVHSIDFHVVSALWMLKVGHLYDSALGDEAFGTRLRRHHSRDSEKSSAKVNLLSIGTFKPYFEPYRDKTIVTGVASCVKRLGSNESPSANLPLALLFPTRPFSVPELYLLAPDLLSLEGKSIIGDWTLAFRGFKPQRRLPGATKDDTVAVPWDERSKKVRIVLTSWKTQPGSWAASATQRNDPDATRYRRLNGLLNNVLKYVEKPRYVVLPELSVPSRWFLRIATKTANRGISLIAGVEYIHHGTKLVANQVWASLVSDFLGFSSIVIYCQDKWRPALHEEADLWSTAGLRLEPIARDEWKPILNHGGFRFGILICSELTNIEYRKELRGMM